MTNEQILQWAASINFAHINITPTCHIRYGRQQWETRLPELTAKQRMTLQGKIERCEARLSKERAS